MNSQATKLSWNLCVLEFHSPSTTQLPCLWPQIQHLPYSQSLHFGVPEGNSFRCLQGISRLISCFSMRKTEKRAVKCIGSRPFNSQHSISLLRFSSKPPRLQALKPQSYHRDVTFLCLKRSRKSLVSEPPPSPPGHFRRPRGSGISGPGCLVRIEQPTICRQNHHSLICLI